MHEHVNNCEIGPDKSHLQSCCCLGHLICNVTSFHQHEYSHGVPPRPLAVTTLKLRNGMLIYFGFKKGNWPITSYHHLSRVHNPSSMESVHPTDLVNLPLAENFQGFQAPWRRVLEKSWLNSAAPICEFQWT